jgi:hypothetical protein
MIDVAYRYIVFRCIAVCLVCFPGVFVEEMILGEFQSVGNDYGFVKNDGRFLERPEEQQKQQSSDGHADSKVSFVYWTLATMGEHAMRAREAGLELLAKNDVGDEELMGCR